MNLRWSYEPVLLHFINRRSRREEIINECPFGEMYNYMPSETKAKGESRWWRYKMERKLKKETSMCLELQNVC